MTGPKIPPFSLTCVLFPDDDREGPVGRWFRSLPVEERRKIGRDIHYVQNNWPVSRPLVGSLGDGIHEVRTSHNNVEYRIAFVVVKREMILLHAFIKKTYKVSQSDMDLIRTRKKALSDK
jgi:phage-related protein